MDTPLEYLEFGLIICWTDFLVFASLLMMFCCLMNGYTNCVDRFGYWKLDGSTKRPGLAFLLTDDFLHFTVSSKIEKVPRGIRGEKSSKDMASSRNLVSTIGALASPKMGDGTRCPEG